MSFLLVVSTWQWVLKAGGHERFGSLLHPRPGSVVFSSGAGGERTHHKRTGKSMFDLHQIQSAGSWMYSCVTGDGEVPGRRESVHTRLLSERAVCALQSHHAEVSASKTSSHIKLNPDVVPNRMLLLRLWNTKRDILPLHATITHSYDISSFKYDRKHSKLQKCMQQ